MEENHLIVLSVEGEGDVLKKLNLLPDLFSLGETYTLIIGRCLEKSLRKLDGVQLEGKFSK